MPPGLVAVLLLLSHDDGRNGRNIVYANDLAAQAAMAESSKGLVTLTLWQVIFGGATLIGLFWTTIYTRKTAHAAIDAVKATRGASDEAQNHNIISLDHQFSSTERQLRAYVSVSPDGVNPLKIRDAVIGHVVVRNVGQVIATKVTIAVKMIVTQDKNLNNFPIDPDDLKPIGALHPNAEFRRGSPQILERSRLVFTDDKRRFIFVWGRVTYEDGFGQPRWINFCYRYNTEGIGWMDSNSGLTKNEARYHETGNDAT